MIMKKKEKHKEKWDVTIKVKGCADGRPQRLYTSKEEMSPPMVSLEAMIYPVQ